MTATFDKRIARARELAESRPAARDFLKFYVKLAQFQKPVFEELNLKEGTCIRDLIRYFPAFLEFVRSSGLDPLIDFANRHLGSVEAQEELLLKCWDGGAGALEESDEGAFFARVLLQPFAESLANRCRADFQPDKSTCPFSTAKPLTPVPQV